MVTIRHAAQKDAAVLSKLCAEVQQFHADHEPGYFKPPASPHFAVGFFQMMLNEPGVTIFIAGEGDVPIGYILTQIIRREDSPFTYQRNFLHVDQIGVLDAHRGKGCGRALMAHARKLAEAENITAITLNSWQFNAGAHAFFHSLGFENITVQMRLNLRE